jgi:hypothetical protein
MQTTPAMPQEKILIVEDESPVARLVEFATGFLARSPARRTLTAGRSASSCARAP